MSFMVLENFRSNSIDDTILLFYNVLYFLQADIYLILFIFCSLHTFAFGNIKLIFRSRKLKNIRSSNISSSLM